MQIRLVSLFFSALMFMQSIHLQAMSVFDYLMINKGTELCAVIQSLGEDENICMVNTREPKEKIFLPANTRIALKTMEDLYQKDIKNGADILLCVAYDIKVKGKIVIPAGSIARGQVTNVQRPKMWGKPGQIKISVTEVFTETETIALMPNSYSEVGESRSTAAWILFGVSMLILWPCIFVPFFLKGKHAVISKGRTIDVFTAQTLKLSVIE